MQTVLIAVHLMIVIALVAVVLLQRSEGGALGVGGGSGFMTGRGQANVLTRATAILATLFFLTSLGLTLLARYGHGNRLDFNVHGRSGPAEPATKLPPTQPNSVLDQVRALEQQRNGASASGATPAAQAPSTPSSAPAPATPATAKAPGTPAPTEPSGMPNRPSPAAAVPAPAPQAVAPAPSATPAQPAAPTSSPPSTPAPAAPGK